MSYSKDEVKESITIDDMYDLLDYLGAEPEMCGDYIKSLTICHGGDSKKLYWYESTSLFHCYTGDCGTFDVFELVSKVKGIKDLNSAIFFVVNFFNLQSRLQEVDDNEYSIEDWRIFRRYEDAPEPKNEDKLVLPEYDDSIVKYYPKPIIKPWDAEGISKEVCDYCGICYDPLNGNILIPHYDEHGRCVGIRQRTLVQENEIYGKYRPWKRGGVLYNHPLGFNLYGLNWAKDRISDMKVAILAEGEKSVLESMTYFGTGNNLTVATCGSSVSRYQFQLLKELGVDEVVIAFDHDFEEVGSEDYLQTEKKIAAVAKKFSSMTRVSVLFDRDGLLGYKQSPFDAGKDVFMYLFKNRIIV